MQYLTSGELVKLLGISKYTLRYYVNQGLISPCTKNHNGYQLYGETEVYMLYHIIFLRKLGFSIKEIKSSFLKNQEFSGSFKKVLSKIEEEIKDLKKMYSKLEEIVEVQNSLEINKVVFIERNIRYLRTVPEEILNNQSELNLKKISLSYEYEFSSFDELCFLLRKDKNEIKTCYRSDSLNYDFLLPKGNYAIKSFIVQNELDVLKEFEVLLNDALFDKQSIDTNYILIYENIPLSLSYCDSMVYSIEVKLK